MVPGLFNIMYKIFNMVHGSRTKCTYSHAIMAVRAFTVTLVQCLIIKDYIKTAISLQYASGYTHGEINKYGK